MIPALSLSRVWLWGGGGGCCRWPSYLDVDLTLSFFGVYSIGQVFFARSAFIYVYCVWGCMYIIYLNIHVFLLLFYLGGLFSVFYIFILYI